MATVNDLLIRGGMRVGRADARVVLGHILEKRKEWLISHAYDEVDQGAEERFLACVEKVAAGMPVPYITGKQEFWGRDFLVNPAVLIPRPDTETLIEKVIELSAGFDTPKILDLGTGSGCIAITLALEIPGSNVTAADISPQAVATARKNAELLGASNAKFVTGSWFDAVPDQKFDIIVSNPPYIMSEDEHLANLRFEPIGALTDGGDGLGCYRTICSSASRYMHRDSVLVFEHGYDQKKPLAAILADNGFVGIECLQDLGGNDRITLARLP